MDTKAIARMNRHEILDALLRDGFEINSNDAAEVSETIQQAARAGALTWTPRRIVSTLHNRPLTINHS
jgi:ABC-type Fe2+-enterobactin transport system substrate-binding protein